MWPRGKQRGLNAETITSRLEANIMRPRWRSRPKLCGIKIFR